MEDVPDAELISTDLAKDSPSTEINAPPSSIVDDIPILPL